jgi:hypothetical protein
MDLDDGTACLGEGVNAWGLSDRVNEDVAGDLGEVGGGDRALDEVDLGGVAGGEGNAGGLGGVDNTAAARVVTAGLWADEHAMDG